MAGECYPPELVIHTAFTTACQVIGSAGLNFGTHERGSWLVQVLTGNDERVATWRQLAQSWQDMWLKWDSEQDSRKAEAQADVGDEERMAFVNSLLAQASTQVHL